jgi:DNA-binding response OmpR family regulator
LLDGKEIYLTTKEFDLLTFLATHPNHVFSRDHLFDKLWGWDSTGDTNTVTVHIRKIREKIELDSSTPQFIETIWGAGYRFNI